MPKSVIGRFSSLFATVIILGSSTIFADVKPNPIFNDGMVIQRNCKAPVWGTANDGEKVTVSFRGRKETTKAKDGKWMLKIKTGGADGPFEMTISGENEIMIENVLVGEVWLCSGQSNMVQTVSGSDTAKQTMADCENPNLRLLKIPRTISPEPLDEITVPWMECSWDSVGSFSSVAYYFGLDLQQNLGVPVGIIQSSFGGAFAESWMSKEALEDLPSAQPVLEFIVKQRVDHEKNKVPKYEKNLAAYKVTLAKAKRDGAKPPKKPNPPRSKGDPSEMFNAMIHPLIPYRIAGAAWYQGEANAINAGFAANYHNVLPALIEDWREFWNQGNFPFLIVQLANFRAKPHQDWPTLREAQTRTLSVKNTAMAVTIDLGEKDNIHPKKKQPVGQRLSLAARAIAYGEDIPYSGPVFRSMRRNGAAIAVKFDHVYDGLEAKGSTVKGFEIAGADKKFFDAHGVISGDSVIVSHPDVAKPVAVRYAWAAFPVCNLYNSAGLPAGPFRTDD